MVAVLIKVAYYPSTFAVDTTVETENGEGKVGKNFTIKDSGLPDLPQMMLATVRALEDMGGSAHLQELDERIAELEDISETEQSIMTSNGKMPKFNYYLAWARTYLNRAGALENVSRGFWALTDEGRKITSVEQTAAIREQVNAEDKKRREEKQLAGKGGTAGESEGEEVFSDDPSDDQTWLPKLLETLREMDPSAFEHLAQRLLREVGFTKVEVLGKTNDGGLDGMGVLRVNLVSFKVYFQCKRWKSNVGAKEIRDFRGALAGRADKGIFITTGDFTSQASNEATRDGATAIDLINGHLLCELLKEHNLGVKTEMVEKVTISEDWFQSI